MDGEQIPESSLSKDLRHLRHLVIPIKRISVRCNEQKWVGVALPLELQIRFHLKFVVGYRKYGKVAVCVLSFEDIHPPFGN